MGMQIGTITLGGITYRAERYSSGSVYANIGGNWYRCPVEQENNFVAA